MGKALGFMGKKMETTVVYWASIGDNGKENGNYNNRLDIYVMDGSHFRKSPS